MSDWTEKDGKANSSYKYLEMVQYVYERLIGSGFTIIDKDTLYSVSRSIIAGLAHEKGMGFPKEDEG